MKNKLLKASLAYTICNILIKGMSFLSIPVFSRLLSIEEYGVFSTYIAYEGIMFVIVGIALHSSLKSAKIEFKGYLDRYCSSILLLPIFNMIFFILVTIIIYPYISNYLGLSRTICILLFIHSLSSAILTFYNEKISLNYDYKSFLKISLLISSMDLLLSINFIVFFFSEDRVLGRVLGSMMPMTIISFILLKKIFKKEKPRYNHDYWKFGITYSVPIVFHGISQVLLSQFDRIMIQNMINASATAIYSLSCNIGSVTTIIGNSISTAWGPFFYSEITSGKVSRIREKSNLFVKIMAFICVVTIFLAPDLLKFIAPKNYWEGRYCVIPIILGAYFTFLYHFPAEIEYYYKKTTYIAASTIAVAIFNVITNFIFIRIFGYIAAAYTTLASYILYFVFHMVVSIKISKKVIYDLKQFMIEICTVLLFSVLAGILIDTTLLRYLMLIIYVMFYLVVNKKIVYKLLMSWRLKNG